MLFSQEIQRRATYKQEIVTLHHILPAPDTSHSLPDDFIHKIQAERIHGLLTVGLSTSSHEWINQQEIPCVNFAGGGTWMVIIDGEELARQATHSLIELGCQNIGLWQFTTQRSEEDIEENGLFKGLKKAYQECNRILSTKFVRIPRLPLTHLYPHKTISFQEQGYMLAKEVFGNNTARKPDGLVIGDEMVAHGALIAFQQMGIRVGKDVQIATHSNVNSPILFGLTDNLLMYDFDARELVQTMFSVLDMLMVGQKPTSRLTRVIPRRRLSSHF